jgi:glyceraldehyde 3-phosphate dehydrogenase
MHTVGINGFGRIGKLVYQILIERGLKVVEINDPFIKKETALNALKYDSTFGRCKNKEVLNSIESLKIMQTRTPEWNCDIVIECSGVNKTIESVSNYNAKYVVITCPSDAPMVIYKVVPIPETKVISCASCTTNCLGPIIKVLLENFGIEHAFMTTIHAVTNTQKPLDSVSVKRSERSLFNIIPTTTGAAKCLTEIFPDLKINGMAFRVPIQNVSVVDLVVQTKKDTSLEEIIEKVKIAAESTLSGVICYTVDNVVSSDYIGSKLSCVLDCNASMELHSKFFKLVCWYDNEFGYSNRVVDVVEELIKRLNK